MHIASFVTIPCLIVRLHIYRRNIIHVVYNHLFQCHIYIYTCLPCLPNEHVLYFRINTYVFVTIVTKPMHCYQTAIVVRRVEVTTLKCVGQHGHFLFIPTDVLNGQQLSLVS